MRSRWGLTAAEATGYAIGISSEALLRHRLSGTPDGQRRLKVEYRRDEQARMAREIIDRVTHHRAVTTDRRSVIGTQAVIMDAHRLLRERMTDCLACLKDGGWHEAKEWVGVARCDMPEEPGPIPYRPENEAEIPSLHLDCTWMGRPWWG